MEQVMLDMIPTGAKAVCHVSQYDIGRTIRFNLRSGGAVYTLSGTETVKVYIKKPDGTTAERNIANTSSTYVDWVTGEGDCDQAGNCECELVITSGTTVIGSKNFTVKIEEDPYNEQGVVTETAGPAIIATFTTNVVDLLQEVKCEINAKQDLHGYDHPWPAGGINKFEVGGRVSQTTANIIYTSDDNYIYLNGTKSGGGYADMSNLTVTLPQGTYYLKAFVISGTASNTVSLYGFNGSDNITGDILGGEKTLTLSETTTFRFRFAVWTDGTVCTNYKVGIVISTSSGIDKFYPYSNVCPIEGFIEANITRCGVNLWDEQWEAGGINANTGANNSEADCIRSKNYIRVQAGETYYFYVGANWTKTYLRARYYNIDGSFNQSTTIAKNTAFTVPSGCEYMRFVTPANEVVTTYGNNLSINSPSSDHDYHAYSGKLIKLEFDDTVYGGVLDVTTGVLTVTHGIKTDLSGYTWKKWVSDGRVIFYSDDSSLFDGINGNSTPVVNTYTGVSPADNNVSAYNKGNLTCCFRYPTFDRFYIRDDNYSDVDTFKATLSTLVLVYELATPFDIDITPVQIEALLGVNNVWHDGNGNTEVKYLYNA